VHGIWDASASGEFLRSKVQPVQEGMKNQICQATFIYNWPGTPGDIKWEIDDGTNALSGNQDLAVSGTTWLPGSVIFQCPDTGGMRVEFESTADAIPLALEDFHVGLLKDFVDSGGAEVITHAEYAATASCEWTRTSTTMGDFSTDSDCPAITVLQSSITVTTADNDLPDLVYGHLPPGVYVVQIMFSGLATTSGAGFAFAVSDGSTEGARVRMANTDATAFGAYPTNLVGVFNYTISGARTFKLQGSSTAGDIRIFNQTSAGQDSETHFIVTRYPLSSEKALNLDTTDWHIDANIGGANPALTLVNEATYRGITNPSLDLVLNSGSAPAEIACATTTESSGLTCTAADESIGISFVPERLGKIAVCFSFARDTQIGASSSIQTVFQIVETPNTAQTVSNPGNKRIPSGFDTGAIGAGITRVDNYGGLCGLFKISSVQKRTYRLFYEQLVSGSITSNTLLADRSGSLGQRDIHVTVRPWNQAFPQPVVNNNVTSTSTDSIKVATAFISYSAGAPIVEREDGDWISGNPSDDGLGNMTITLISGIFSALPNCFVTTDSGNTSARAFVLSATSVDVDIVLNSTGAAFDSDLHIACFGPK